MARTQYTVTFPAAKAGDQVTWPTTVKVYQDKDAQVPLQPGQSLSEALTFSGWSESASVTFARRKTDGTTEALTVTSAAPTGTGAAPTSTNAASGVPAGGTTGQVLKKNSNTDSDVGWGNTTALSNATPQALGTAGPGTATDASRSDHVHSSPLGTAFMFGDGSDGNLTFDGTNAVANFNRSGTVYTHFGNAPVMAANLNVSAGVTVNMNTVLLYVSGTLTNAGTIVGGYKDATGATAGSVGFLGSPQIGAGGDGGAGTTGAGGAGAGAQASGKSPAAGGSGGAGGTGAAGSGGANSNPQNDARVLTYRTPLTAFTGHTAWITGGGRLGGGSGGGGGGGDGTNAGGGGGSGGNTLVVNARILVNNGVLSAHGGNGAAGVAGNAGGGGGGSGGYCFVNTTAASGSGTVDANGGTGGAGVGTGATGSAGGAGIAQLVVWA